MDGGQVRLANYADWIGDRPHGTCIGLDPGHTRRAPGSTPGRGLRSALRSHNEVYARGNSHWLRASPTSQSPNATPVITSNGGAATASVNAPENQTFADDVNASDADGNETVSYSISGGADQAKFDLNATTGVLTFKTAPDFENPASAGSNNAYVVEVNASDGTAWDLQTITVTVTDGNEDPTTIALVGAVSSLAEDSNTSSSTKVGAIAVTDPDTTNSSSLAEGNVHRVPSEFATIQAAINASSNGDEVFVSAGTYMENLNFNGKNISVIGEDRATTVIDGNKAGSVVTFSSSEAATAKLSGFTLTNGLTAGKGGGVYINGAHPTIENLIITDNQGNSAGGIGADYSSSILKNLIISNNHAEDSGGGLFVNFASPTVTNVLFTGNTAAWRGGAVGILRSQSNPVFSNVTLSANTGSTVGWGGGGGGGFAFWNGGNASIKNSIVYGNTVSNNTGPNLYMATDEPPAQSTFPTPT